MILKNKFVWKKVALVAALMMSCAGVDAQSMDAGFKAQLDSTGLKYSVTKSGNAALTYALDGERTQVVYVSAKISKVGDLALREIWSNAGTVPADVSFDVLLGLLTGGGDENIGAWNLEESDDGYLVYYSARVSALTGDDLGSVLEYIADVADAKESELSDDDEN